jgi:hypothetical protein
MLETSARVDQEDERGHEHRKVIMDRRAISEHRKVERDRARPRTSARMDEGRERNRGIKSPASKDARGRDTTSNFVLLEDSAPSMRHRKVRQREVSSDPDLGLRKMIEPPGYCTRADSSTRPDELGETVPRS